MRSAETAIQTLNGRKIFDTEIKVNWAYQNQLPKEDVTFHNHVFVGDLSPEVNDEILRKAFSAFGSLSDCRVMWDMASGKSRGYGFLAFRDRADAEQAIATMNGEWLGSRAIRVNWANQKNTGMMGDGGMGAIPPMSNGTGTPMISGPQTYENVISQVPNFNTTIYVGNLVSYCTQADLIPLFQGYGYIAEIRMQADRGFAFVKMDSHENAALAIANLNGTPVHSRPIKCSWGKDRMAGEGSVGTAPVSAVAVPVVSPPSYSAAPAAAAAYGQYPYSAAYVGQSGYPGYGQQPGTTAGQQPQWDQAAYAAYYAQYSQQQAATQ